MLAGANLSAVSETLELAGSGAQRCELANATVGTLQIDHGSRIVSIGSAMLGALDVQDGVTVAVDAGSTLTVAAALSLSGTQLAPITMESSTPGSQWFLTLASGAMQSVTYVAAQDSDANGQVIQDTPNGSNLGNDVGWNFGSGGGGGGGGTQGTITASISFDENPTYVLSANASASATDTVPSATLSYAWSSSSAVSIGSTTQPSTSLTFSAAGTYAITITVTDLYGYSGSATSSITVNNPTLTNKPSYLSLSYAYRPLNLGPGDMTVSMVIDSQPAGAGMPDTAPFPTAPDPVFDNITSSGYGWSTHHPRHGIYNVHLQCVYGPSPAPAFPIRSSAQAPEAITRDCCSDRSRVSLEAAARASRAARAARAALVDSGQARTRRSPGGPGGPGPNPTGEVVNSAGIHVCVPRHRHGPVQDSMRWRRWRGCRGWRRSRRPQQPAPATSSNPVRYGNGEQIVTS